jgi:hypothetical protein
MSVTQARHDTTGQTTSEQGLLESLHQTQGGSSDAKRRIGWRRGSAAPAR